MADGILQQATITDLQNSHVSKPPVSLVADIIIANAPDPVFVSDLEGKILQANDAVFALLGFRPDDTGPGIRPELQGRIFEPFFTTKPAGLGTGLGLPLCRGIIEGHGGTIRVRSQLGQGTVFRIELPVGAEPMAEPSPPAVVVLESAQAKAQAVLVVDDEPGIASALAYLLSRSGYVVDTTANGRLALAKLPEAREFLEKVDVARLSKPFRAAELRRLVHQALHAP
jgi:Histidine kinase-, DNA gyrase B-, and HSP90-like ATPase/PAS domain